MVGGIDHSFQTWQLSKISSSEPVESVRPPYIFKFASAFSEHKDGSTSRQTYTKIVNIYIYKMRSVSVWLFGHILQNEWRLSVRK